MTPAHVKAYGERPKFMLQRSKTCGFPSLASGASLPPHYGFGLAGPRRRAYAWAGMSHTNEELREYARARRAELLRKERAYELPGHLRGEPVAVNATVGGNRFDVNQLRHAQPAPSGLFPWLEASDKMTWLAPLQVELLAAQTKIYETRVHAVHARALLRIAGGVITTTAQIDALNWPA